MIDAVSYMHVFVKYYFYDSDKRSYDISLMFQLHDAFGLNSIDVGKFGFEAEGLTSGTATTRAI